MKTIIISEDPICLMVCERIIQREKFCSEIDSYGDLATALEELKGDKMPSETVILLDGHPEIKWELLADLKPQYGIFLMTHTVDPEDYVKTADSGNIRRFVSKPLNPDTLTSIAHQIENGY